MRAGRLKTPADLLGAAGDVLLSARVGIAVNDGADYRAGLAQAANYTIRARWRDEVVAGRYWRTADHLYLIGPVSNPDGLRRDALMNAQMLSGLQAAVQGVADPVLCALMGRYQQPESEHDYLTAATGQQAEFCNAQYRPEVGDSFEVAGQSYDIQQIDADNSDHVVTRVWIV